MSHKVKVQLGGAANATVHDFSEQVLIYDKEGQPAIHGGGQVDDGSASVGEFVLYDDVQAIEIPYGTTAVTTGALQLASRNPFWWIEDSPGYDSWLSAGWIDLKDIGRFGHPVADERVFRASWQDMNAELRGIPLLADHTRPEETDVERVQWVIDTFYSGNKRPSTTIIAATDHLIGTGTDSAAITMPSKKYEAGSAAVEIIEDCASTGGKIFGVVRHDTDSATHKCLLYIGSQDYDTYTTDAKISDELDDWDPTDATAPVFEPHWMQEAAVSEDPTNMVSGIVSRWSGGVVNYVSDALRDIYNYFVESYSDDQSTTEAQATARASAMTLARSPEHITHMPSVLISPSQHPLLREGMSIQIKSRAAMGGQYAGTYRTRRIAKVNYEPAGTWNGEPVMWAHLELDRPEWRVPANSGKAIIPKPPSPGTPGTTTPWEHYTWEAGQEIIANPYIPLGGATQQMFDQGTATGPEPGAAGTSFCGDTGSGGGSGGSGNVACTAGLTYSFSGYSQGYGESWPCIGHGLVNFSWGVIWYDSAGAQLQIDIIGSHASQPQDGPFVGPDVASIAAPAGAVFFRLSANVDSSMSCQPGHTKLDEVTIEVVTAAVPGDDPPPASDDDTGSIGTPGQCFATCDHKHPAQTAAVTPFTPTGTIAATNVQAAIAEVASEAVTLSNATPLVESGTGTPGTATDASRSDHVHPADAGGGGGAGGWDLAVDEAGTSFANFTGLSGTWASDGTIIKQTDASAAFARAKYNTVLPLSEMMVEYEFRFASGNSGDDYGGALLGFDGTTGGGGLSLRADRVGTPTITLERDGVGGGQSISHTWALNTWYTIRAHRSGTLVAVYIDGTFKGVMVQYPTTILSYFGMVTFAAEVHYRNIKVWTPSLP